MTNKIVIKGQTIFLREKRLEDAPLDYSWRLDEELSDLDATVPIRMSYSQYLRVYEDELSYPVSWSKRFAVETYDNKTIGNCMYYDIDLMRQQTELGIMIGDKEYWNHGFGTDVVNTLVQHIFSTTRINRVYLHTLIWNIRAQKSFAKSGFYAVREVTRRGYNFLLMELTRESWEDFFEITEA
ncbi:MAG: GNAT family N-acetyltransferase [Dehalococcoidia bacterium]|nr:GNAT family N-acetyltransferase [Dehalococcoidia bacterium]MQF99772.1 GNAT family N-acetyltransferase [SAR202 cluster bacterium]|tara:strand:- start:149 stop:697 length:549 start_codon:yes stop_codon:yes gene_type:complete